MGVKITFKDKKKYVDSITASYGIGPAVPKITSAAGSKKALSVRWSYFTSAQLKNIDGMYIEVSTDKYFLNNHKRIKVTKKTLKNGRVEIKKLKANKKYYVRAATYSNIKQKGEKFQMYSADSKVMTGKTR